MTVMISRRFRPALCVAVLVALAVPAGATSTVTGNTSRLSVNVDLNPSALPTAPVVVSPVLPGSPPALVSETLLDASSAVIATGSGVAPMQLTLLTDLDGVSNFGGLSALSGGPFLVAANVQQAGGSALSEAEAKVDVSFTLDSPYDFVLDVTTLGPAPAPGSTVPMHSMADLRGTPLGSLVTLVAVDDGWDGSGIKHYAATLPAGDYRLMVGSMLHASALHGDPPAAAAGVYDIDFTLTPSVAAIPEPLTGACVLAAVGALAGYVRKRRPAAQA